MFNDESTLYYGLIDILFSYCYEARVCELEFNVGSTWSICTLSATLSCLEEYESIDQVIRTMSSRSLVFPFVRNFKAIDVVKSDVLALLKAGRRHILKILLNLHSLFEHDDLRYLVNDLYLSDYCIWIQKYAKDAVLAKLCQKIEKVDMISLKDSLNEKWNLDEYESILNESDSESET